MMRFTLSIGRFKVARHERTQNTCYPTPRAYNGSLLPQSKAERRRGAMSLRLKVSIPFLASFVLPVLAWAQVTELWVAHYHGPLAGNDVAKSIALDRSTGNVYVTGQSQGAGTGLDYATVAYDSRGNQLWTARYDGPASGDDIPNAIAVDSNTGNVYVTGQSQRAGTGTDYATVAYDSSGNQLWVARFENGAGLAIAVDTNRGSVYVTGHLQENNHPFRTTIAYDSTGNQLWAARFGGPGDTGIGNAIAADSTSGNVYVTGQHFDDAPFITISTIAYDSTGNQLWVQEAGSGKDGGYGLTIADTGHIFIAGLRLFDEGDFLTTVAYDPNGNKLWENDYLPTSVSGEFLAPLSIGVDSSTERAYVAGSFFFSAVSFLNFTTVAYDPGGNRVWTATNGLGGASGIAVDSGTGNLYVTGNNQNQGGGTNYATVAYDSSGNQLWTASHSNGAASAIALDTKIHHVYVTGHGQGAGTSTDFTTIAYSQDTIPPVTSATPVPAPNSNGWNNTNVTVTLNSTDNQGGTGVKQIQFSLAGAQTSGPQVVPGSTASVLISSEGTTTLTYFATDNAGNVEQPKSLVIKIDKTPPVISGMPVPGCSLWPPNHKLVEVAVVTAADSLSGLALGSFVLVGTSNEPPQDPARPEIVIAPDSSGAFVLQLQADRLGAGTGRVYTLTATAADLAGNVTTLTATCVVPHDQR
jgi:hypothetical protein